MKIITYRGIKPIENDTEYCFFDNHNHRYYLFISPYTNGKYHYYITKDYERGNTIMEDDNVDLLEIKKVVKQIENS